MNGFTMRIAPKAVPIHRILHKLPNLICINVLAHTVVRSDFVSIAISRLGCRGTS
jgi:hypothetical protein